MFIDSNTLLYTFDRLELEKSESAQRWLRVLADHRMGVTNLQVLNEVANVAIRKASRFGKDDPFFRIDAFARFGTTPVTFETSIAARAYHAKFRYSWWDCLLLASAIELGCTHFLSEDLQDGRTIEGLTIVDPFAHSPERILVS
ncbi:MAG: PIN domain-containing protein [Rhizobiaceae bacterium]